MAIPSIALLLILGGVIFYMQKTFNGLALTSTSPLCIWYSVLAGVSNGLGWLIVFSAGLMGWVAYA